MFHKVKNVEPLDNMLLLVEFVNGEKKRYDVKPLISRWKVFNDLTDNSLFNLVKIDCGGYGIAWNEYIDLSCEELWNNGSSIRANDPNYNNVPIPDLIVGENKSEYNED